VDEQVQTVDYQQFFNSLPNPYIAFLPNDPVFTIIAENEAHAKVALGNVANSIGKATFDVFPDNSQKYKTTGVSDLLESFRKVIRTHKPDTMPILNYDVPGPDGKFVEKWWRVTHYPVLDINGNLSFFYQATVDITDEMVTSQKLELAQSQLDSALAIGLVSAWSLDIQSNTVIGDKNLATSFGVEPEEVAKGLPLTVFTDSIHKDDQKRITASIQKCIKDETEYEEEYRTTNKDGEIRWVIARGRLEPDAAGKPAYFLGVNVDITDRKKAEGELTQIKSMFDALFESTIMSVALADLDGNILQANRTFLRTFGYTKRDFEKGFTSSQITPPQSKAVTSKIYDTIRKHGEAEPVEKEYIRKDGTLIPMLVGAAVLPNNKNQFIAFMLDISENKELKALNAAKDEFIGMASHQLRTPATIVKQYVSLLKSGFAGPLTETQQNYVDKAYASNERQLNIVNDLLKTAQIDSDRYLLKKEHLAVSELIKNAVSELEDTLQEKKQTLSVANNISTVKVLADRTELNLVFVNLIENASKYSASGSTITITSSLKPDVIEIAITDEGVGIDKEDQKRVFQKFTRVDNALSDTVSGSGLGLYLVDRIAKLHHGNIKVISSTGKGSTFIVSLPYER
jgi:PAS domain S-box-containing protein